MLATFDLDQAPNLSKSVSSFKSNGSENEVPRNLDHLVLLIRNELGDHGLDSEHVDVPKIMKLMSEYRSKPEDWIKYAHFDDKKYTRNLVDSGNGSFNLLVLAWGPGQASPIHDHAGSHCIMKILDGQLQEYLYSWPEDHSNASPMRCNRTTSYHKNQVTYIHDKIGLHRVKNATSSNSLSLHLYTPPITHAFTFQESTSQPRAAGNCTFYSVHGSKLHN